MDGIQEGDGIGGWEGGKCGCDGERKWLVGKLRGVIEGVRLKRLRLDGD